MADALDHLEIAKLATSIGSQLRDMDSRTEGAMVNANRLDTRRFIQNVVQAANPNAHQNNYNGQQNQNSEEERLMEMLNREAMGQVPDISQGSPSMIPMPVNNQPQQQYIPPPVAAPNVVEQRVQYPIGIPQQSQGDPIREIADAVKSIDTSLQALCTVFIVKAKKKKKRKVTPKQNSTQEVTTTDHVPSQPLTQKSQPNVS